VTGHWNTNPKFASDFVNELSKATGIPTDRFQFVSATDVGNNKTQVLIYVLPGQPSAPSISQNLVTQTNAASSPLHKGAIGANVRTVSMTPVNNPKKCSNGQYVDPSTGQQCPKSSFPLWAIAPIVGGVILIAAVVLFLCRDKICAPNKDLKTLQAVQLQEVKKEEAETLRAEGVTSTAIEGDGTASATNTEVGETTAIATETETAV